MPLGDKVHMLPVKVAVRKAIKKGVGDTVAVTMSAVATYHDAFTRRLLVAPLLRGRR